MREKTKLYLVSILMVAFVIGVFPSLVEASTITPVGNKGPWYRDPPEDANTNSGTTVTGGITIDWYNWYRDDPNFKAWYYAYRVQNDSFAPYAATFALLFPHDDPLDDLNIQGEASSLFDDQEGGVGTPPHHNNWWTQVSGYDPNVPGLGARMYFGWRATSAAAYPSGDNDGIPPGFSSTGGSGDAYFEIVSFDRAPAQAEFKINDLDEMYAGSSDPQITGVIWGPAPEPATISLLGLGGLALLRRRKK